MNESEGITLEGFRRLPALLPRKKFLQVTGLTSGELSAAVKAGEIVPWTAGALKGRRRYGKYKKVDAARISGFPL